jgi:hypothetical protein
VGQWCVCLVYICWSVFETFSFSGKRIHQGVHCPIEDAQVSMELFNLVETNWDGTYPKKSSYLLWHYSGDQLVHLHSAETELRLSQTNHDGIGHSQTNREVLCKTELETNRDGTFTNRSSCARLNWRQTGMGHLQTNHDILYKTELETNWDGTCPFTDK